MFVVVVYWVVVGSKMGKVILANVVFDAFFFGYADRNSGRAAGLNPDNGGAYDPKNLKVKVKCENLSLAFLCYGKVLVSYVPIYATLPIFDNLICLTPF